MSVKKIERNNWQHYFDTFSKAFLKDLQPEYAEIRILSKELGLQPETQWIPLKGISYDPRGDLLEITVDELEHMIHNPSEIYVDEEENGWVISIEVIDKEGTTNIIEIR